MIKKLGMDSADGINNNWGTYLKNLDQAMFRYFFEAELSKAINYFELPAAVAVPVVDDAVPISNKAKSDANTAKDNLAEDPE